MLSVELRALSRFFEGHLGGAEPVLLEPAGVAGLCCGLAELARQAEALERHTVPFEARLDAANAPEGGNVVALRAGGRRASSAPPWGWGPAA